LLAGSWRAVPPRLDVEVSTVGDLAPLLFELGASGLVWWKLLHSAIETSSLEQLSQAYRQNALRAPLHMQSIRVVVPRLRAAGIDPVLIKGWSSARLYPRPGLRPYLDLDLVVPPGQRARAEAILQAGSPLSCPDHADVLDGATWSASDWEGESPEGDLADHSWEAVLERTLLVPLGDMSVRVLGPEDHLRLAAVHAVRHKFDRPVWLCDIALLVETLPDGFDWSYCLAGCNRNTERVVRSVGLAHQVLEADLRHCPPSASDVPAWLIRAVLRRWGTLPIWGPGPSIVLTLRHPRTLPRELYRRWPDPLESSLRFNLSLTGNSRLAAQAHDFVLRLGVPLARRLRQGLRHA
jgi:hypothetical protein